MAAIVQIQRDPFARATLERTTVARTGNCKWCGMRRPGGRLFRYRWQPDGISQRSDWDEGAYCQVSCYRAFHE